MGVFVVSDVFAEDTEFKIPDWVKKVAGLWHDDRIGDNTFLNTIKWLIDNEIIILPTTDTEDKSSNEVPDKTIPVKPVKSVTGVELITTTPSSSSTTSSAN